MSADGTDETEQFYTDFWTTSVWSGAEPNIDEQMRIAAIERAIEANALAGRILDLGCGRGCITAALERHGDVTGIDTVKAGIRRGNELFPHLDLQHRSIEDLNSTAAGSFDVVVCSEVIEHVPQRQQQRFASEILRSLRAGGVLLLTTPRGELHERWRRHVDSDQPVEDWLTELALLQLLTTVGFDVIHQQRFGVYPISRWRVPLVVSPVRSLCGRSERVRRIVDRAGIYQLVVARVPATDS